ARPRSRPQPFRPAHGPARRISRRPGTSRPADVTSSSHPANVAERDGRYANDYRSSDISTEARLARRGGKAVRRGASRAGKIVETGRVLAHRSGTAQRDYAHLALRELRAADVNP